MGRPLSKFVFASPWSGQIRRVDKPLIKSTRKSHPRGTHLACICFSSCSTGLKSRGEESSLGLAYHLGRWSLQFAGGFEHDILF
jgi:hypothetical protein